MERDAYIARCANRKKKGLTVSGVKNCAHRNHKTKKTLNARKDLCVASNRLLRGLSRECGAFESAALVKAQLAGTSTYKSKNKSFMHSKTRECRVCVTEWR